MRITITRHVDDDHFDILAESGTHKATAEIYCETARLADFGRQLMEFPRDLRHEVVFQSGSESPSYVFLVRLRAFVHDSSGHVALEVFMRSRFDPPNGADSHFFIHSDAAALNRLGAALLHWAQTSEGHFEFDRAA